MRLTFDGDQSLLEQGFAFRPARWQRSYLADALSGWLDTLPEDPRGHRYRRIERRDLLRLARDTSPDGQGRLLLACYVWGTGPSGFLVGRRARTFRDTPPAALVDHLTAVRAVLANEGPVAAYSAMHNGGPHRIRWMAASFFTKFLYAADTPDGFSCGRALILDQFVVAALGDLHGWSLPRVGPWAPQMYERWLGHASEVAEQASLEAGSLVRLDAVEKAYFEHGKVLRRRYARS